MHVFRTLLYLRLTTLRNKAGSQLRRLRQPKYFFGAVAGAAYFWFFFFRHTTGRSGPGRAFDELLAPGSLELIAAVVLTLFLVLIWITPSDNPGLAFSEAEVAFLFPAPFARRQLIHYKLVDGLLMSLLGAVFFTLIAGGWNKKSRNSRKVRPAWRRPSIWRRWATGTGICRSRRRGGRTRGRSRRSRGQRGHRCAASARRQAAGLH